MNKYFSTALLVVTSLLFGISVSQTGWAAFVNCSTTALCQGTTGDDIMFAESPNNGMSGLAGNDIIIGFSGPYNNYIYGGPGNDTLIGGLLTDNIYGGLGDDRIEGGKGDDIIWEGVDINSLAERFEGNDDISGGPGNDFIAAGGGSDRIFGGPGNDELGSSSFNRDFVKDQIDCGSGTDTVNQFNSADGDTAVYCETINNSDG